MARALALMYKMCLNLVTLITLKFSRRQKYIYIPAPKLVILGVGLHSVTKKEQIKINQCKEVDSEY